MVLASQLERTCEAMGAWQRLSELLVARAQRTSDRPQKGKLLLRAATLIVEDAGARPEALVLLALACAECPESVEVRLELARVLLALNRPGEALVVLDPVSERARCKSAALRSEVLLTMGKAHLALEQLAAAFGRLETAFSLHTRDREVAMLLGCVALDLGDANTAERALSAVCKLASCDDSAGGEDAAADARVASRLLASIAESRHDRRQHLFTHSAGSRDRSRTGIRRRSSAAVRRPR
jgi:predicted Zn-dependent protease